MSPIRAAVPFVRKALEVHGDKYDYSQTVFVDTDTKVDVSCPACGGTAPLTTEEFLARARETHGDRYDYSDSVYAGMIATLTIGCQAHGPYEQLGYLHLRGHGCRACGNEQSAATRRATAEGFIARAKEKHGDRYGYELVDYRGANDRVLVVCRLHGPFSQVAVSHTRGSGCPRCAVEATAAVTRSTKEKFVESATVLHGTKYDYSEVVYEGTQRKVTIKCTTCGNQFQQAPAVHLSGYGCSPCGEYSGESVIRTFLTASGLEFVAQFTHDDLRHKGKLRVDFAVPELKLAIEFDGVQHHRPVMAWGVKTWEEAEERFAEQQLRDAAKDAWAVWHGWTLVRITSIRQVAEALEPYFALGEAG